MLDEAPAPPPMLRKENSIWREDKGPTQAAVAPQLLDHRLEAAAQMVAQGTVEVGVVLGKNQRHRPPGQYLGPLVQKLFQRWVENALVLPHRVQLHSQTFGGQFVLPGVDRDPLRAYRR